MKSSIIAGAVFVATLLFILAPSSARADHQDKIFTRHCGYYHSSRDFVQKAALYCISKTGNKDCLKQAKQYFRQCSFRGDFSRLNGEVHTGVLFMLVLAGAPEIAHLRHDS